MSEEEKLIIVFAGNISQADLVKHILEAHGIKAFLKDESLGTIAPWYAAPGGAGAVKVQVAESDVENALILIKEMSSQSLKEQTKHSSGKPWRCPACGEEIEGQFNRCWKCQTSRLLDLNEL